MYGVTMVENTLVDITLLNNANIQNKKA